MKITDACVYPYPCGDSSVRRMALEARTLGFDGIVAIDTPSCTIDGTDVRSGIRIQASVMKDVISRVRQEKETGADV